MLKKSFASLMRTTTVRLSFLYILVSCLCAVSIVWYIGNTSFSLLVTQIQHDLQKEVDNLSASYRQEGVLNFLRTVDRRSRQPGAYLYLVTDNNGRMIVGNIYSIDMKDSREVLDPQRLVAYQRYALDNYDTQTDNHQKYHALVATMVFPDGVHLLVGRDLSELHIFLQIIHKALALALIVMFLGSLCIWYFVGRSALNKIDQLRLASKKIIQGGLSERLPDGGVGDEFDRLAIDLNQMLERIEILNEELLQISDNIAHDLKTPLTRLRNRVSHVLAQKQQDVDYHAVLERIQEDCNAIIHTFHSLLMISRYEAMTSFEHLEILPLRIVIEDVLDLYTPLLEDADFQLCISALYEHNVQMNKELIAQILINLLDNIIKYGKAPAGQQSIITIAMKIKDEYVQLELSDNGCGVAPEDYEKITRRFVRLDASRSQDGFGLGLALAHAVMRLHQGKICFADAEPGLRVILSFPLVNEDIEARISPVADFA